MTRNPQSMSQMIKLFVLFPLELSSYSGTLHAASHFKECFSPLIISHFSSIILQPFNFHDIFHQEKEKSSFLWGKKKERKTQHVSNLIVVFLSTQTGIYTTKSFLERKQTMIINKSVWPSTNFR